MKTSMRAWLGVIAAAALAGTLSGCATEEGAAGKKSGACCSDGSGTGAASCCDTPAKADQKPAKAN
jgi:hypothetical protein